MKMIPLLLCFTGNYVKEICHVSNSTSEWSLRPRENSNVLEEPELLQHKAKITMLNILTTSVRINLECNNACSNTRNDTHSLEVIKEMISGENGLLPAEIFHKIPDHKKLSTYQNVDSKWECCG